MFYSYISGSNFLRLKNSHIFQETEHLDTSLKNFFFRRSLRVFHPCFFRYFHFSPLIFITIFRFFSLLIAFFHVISFAAFLSGTLFLCCSTGSATDLRELCLLSLPYSSSRYLAQKASWKQQGLPWRLHGLPHRFKTQTRPIYLFESHSIQQKVLVGRFYLCINKAL